MPMDAREIERMIVEALPDAKVEIRDLAGDGDHYAATVLSHAFKGRPGLPSTRWSTAPFRAAWAGFSTPLR